MKAIKRKILHPVLKLYSPNKTLLAILTNKNTKIAYDIVKKTILNDVATLTFKVPFDNTVISSDSAEMLVKLENEYYIIKTIKLNDESKRILDITCESEFIETKGIKCQPLDLIGQSPEELFNAIVASPKNVNLVGQYKWLGTDIVDTYRAVQTEDEVSVFENWLTMCKKFEAWMEFSTDEYGQKWVFLRKNAINNGKFVRKGQGLKSLDITFDTTGIFTRMYGYGANDSDTGNEITFISVNPESKAYVEDISYYIAKGMTKEEIYATPRCVQETDYTDNTITEPSDLFRITKEELAKVCVPTIDGNIGISDFSVYEDTSITEPVIGETVIVIDQDINYSISTQIQSVERKYTENPFDITVEISNVIKYDSVLKDLQHSSDVVTNVTSVNSDGKVVVNTTTLQGDINAQNTTITGTVDLTTSEDKQSTIAILFQDTRIGYPTYGALGIGTKGICIAKELNTDGTWNWQVFGTVNGFNASLIKTGILKSINDEFSFDLDSGVTNVPTQTQGTSDNQIANTKFVVDEIEAKKTIVGTISSSLTIASGSIDLTITGLGTNPIIVTNGNYINNSAQIVGVDNKSTDVITVHYINGTIGNCKFNYTYSK